MARNVLTDDGYHAGLCDCAELVARFDLVLAHILGVGHHHLQLGVELRRRVCHLSVFARLQFNVVVVPRYG